MFDIHNDDEVKKQPLDRLPPNGLSADMQDNMIERTVPEDYDIPPSR